MADQSCGGVLYTWPVHSPPAASANRVVRFAGRFAARLASPCAAEDEQLALLAPLQLGAPRLRRQARLLRPLLCRRRLAVPQSLTSRHSSICSLPWRCVPPCCDSLLEMPLNGCGLTARQLLQ